MRIAGLLALVIFLPTSVQAAVVINEIAWMGTAASANAEWMELYNSGSTSVDLTNWHLVAAHGSPSITLAGSISANGYFLLERTNDSSVPSVTADQIYTGALTNSGTTLTLTDASGNTSDTVTGGANWANVGGDNANKETAQRTSSGWETAAATPRGINAGVTDSSSSASAISGTSSGTASTTTMDTSSSSSSSPPEYIPIPILRIVIHSLRNVSSGADTAFTATVYDNKGNKRNDAFVTWSFGDGMRKTGASVFHAYYDPGEYLAVVHATTPDGGDALTEITITVKDANIQITSLSSRGIALTNNSTRTLDLSLWRLTMGGKEFKIPEDTHILAGRAVLFPVQVHGLPLANSASLLYPNGEVAAMYPVVAMQGNEIVQPSFTPVSYEKVQAVDNDTPAPLISRTTNIQTHEEAVSAPSPVSITKTGEGAALSPVQPESTTRTSSGIFKSPWTFGFLGVVALAASAFIFL